MWEGMIAFPYTDMMSFPFTQSCVWFLTLNALSYKDRNGIWVRFDSHLTIKSGLYPHVLSFTTLSKKGKPLSSFILFCVYQPAPRIANRNLCSQMKGEGGKQKRCGNDLNAMNDEYRETSVEGKGTLCSLSSRPITVLVCLPLDSWPTVIFRTKTLREVQCW